MATLLTRDKFSSHPPATPRYNATPLTSSSPLARSTIDPEQQQFIGRYKLLERLNEGGQGTVYRAWDAKLKRDVAVKISHARLTSEMHAFSHSLREGTLLAQLDHPSLAKVYECGMSDEQPFLVLEFVPGVNLREYVTRNALRPKQIERIMLSIARAVAAAHDAGILHLDLKPENVMVTPDGQIKLIDFGLGWIPSSALEIPVPAIAGTPGYMSPEQQSGLASEWSVASDLFGLGALLYFLLTGQPPLSGQATTQDCHVELELESACSTLQRSGQPARLIQICCHAIQLDPARRPESARAFCRQLLARQRAIDRILAAGLVLTGICLLLLGIPLKVDPISDRQDKFVDPVTVNSISRQALSLTLDLHSPHSFSPTCLFWTPETDLKEILGLQRESPDGMASWRLRSRQGNVLFQSSGGRFCLLTFSRPLQIDLAELQRTIKSADQILIAEVQRLPHSSSTEYSFGHQSRLLDQNLAETHLPSSLLPLKKLLDDLKAPYCCTWSLRSRDPSQTWRLDARYELDSMPP